MLNTLNHHSSVTMLKSKYIVRSVSCCDLWQNISIKGLSVLQTLFHKSSDFFR